MIFEKILIAEDDSVLSFAIKQHFEKRVKEFNGAKITIVATPCDALKYLLEETPDLTVLDLGLGDGLPGIDIIKQVKGKLPARCKIFVYSGYPKYESECLAAGAVAFIDKELQLPEIVQVIRKHCFEPANQQMDQ